MSVFKKGLDTNKNVKRLSVRNYLVTELQIGLSNENAEGKASSFMRASSCGVCARKNVYAHNYLTPGGHSYSSNITMEIGTAVHEMIQRYFLNTQYMTLAEPTFELPDFKISGHTDGLCIDPIMRIPYVIDFKTCGDLPRKPKFEHVRQLHVYSVLSGFTGDGSLELMYVSRNYPHKMTTFSVWDNKIFDEVIETIVTSLDHWETGVIPNRPFTSQTHCTYCAFKDICWEEGNDHTSDERYNGMTEYSLRGGLQTRRKETLHTMLYSGRLTDIEREIINEQINI